MIELLNPTTKSLFGFAQRIKPALAALLILVHLPHFFSFAPFGKGVHAPGGSITWYVLVQFNLCNAVSF